MKELSVQQWQFRPLISLISNLTSTSLKEGKLTIDGGDLGMKYEGVWNKATNEIEGTYNEGGVKLVLTLKKGNPVVTKLKRSQEPVKPYPYYEEKVNFNNVEAGISLSGTFTRPAQKGKYPVVILIEWKWPA